MVDVWSMLQSGGRRTIDLLEYSVASVRLEILFGYLATEYRNQPTAHRAVALYDVFCAHRAPGRIHAPAVLPPHDLSLTHAIERIREHLREVELHNAEQPETPMSFWNPGRHLFDTVSAAVRNPEHPVVRAVCDDYDPALNPVENLAGGRRSASQRMFIEREWRPRLRPFLVQYGFPRLASIGG
jgi:hypothetical protein